MGSSRRVPVPRGRRLRSHAPWELSAGAPRGDAHRAVPLPGAGRDDQPSAHVPGRAALFDARRDRGGDRRGRDERERGRGRRTRAPRRRAPGRHQHQRRSLDPTATASDPGRALGARDAHARARRVRRHAGCYPRTTGGEPRAGHVERARRAVPARACATTRPVLPWREVRRRVVQPPHEMGSVRSAALGEGHLAIGNGPSGESRRDRDAPD